MSNKISDSNAAANAAAAAAKLRASSSGGGGGKGVGVAVSAPAAATDRLNQTVKRQQIEVPLLYQYTGKDQNACGTTSLTMILQHYGKKITREEVDAKIRQIDGPTSPASIVSFAKEQGLNAALYNRGSVDELKKFLDRGIPLEVMIDPDANPNDTVLHYVVVTGYEADPKTGKTNLLINDPARLEPVRMSETEFLEKWSSLKIKNFDSGLDKFFIAIAPKDAELPGSRMAGGHTASIAFRGIAVGERVGRWGIDTGNAISKAATNAWNTVKGWFGG